MLGEFNMKELEINKRNSIFDYLNKYDYLLTKDNKDIIEITEWTNGEGLDISIRDSKLFSLTYGELSAINYLVKTLHYKQNEAV